MPSWLARVLAALVAVGLVAGAFVIRGVLSDDDGAAAGPDGDRGRSSGGGYRVLCDADLGEEVCDGLSDDDSVDEITVVTAGQVLDAATAQPGQGDLDLATFDAWLTLDPMPRVLKEARRFANLQPLAVGEAEPIASSPLVVLVAEDSRLDCVDAATADWVCLTEAVSPAVAVPSVSTSLGMIVVGAAGDGLIDEPTFAIGIEAFRATEAGDLLQEWVHGSPDAAGTSAAAQATASLSPGRTSGAVTVEAVGSAAADTAQGRDRDLETVPIEPPVTVGAVLVGLGERGSDAVADLDVTADSDDDGVVAALAEAGWDLDPKPSSGLLDPDVVYALREEVG